MPGFTGYSPTREYDRPEKEIESKASKNVPYTNPTKPSIKIYRGRFTDNTKDAEHLGLQRLFTENDTDNTQLPDKNKVEFIDSKDNEKPCDADTTYIAELRFIFTAWWCWLKEKKPQEKQEGGSAISNQQDTPSTSTTLISSNSINLPWESQANFSPFTPITLKSLQQELEKNDINLKNLDSLCKNAEINKDVRD